jgi:hypothetical protein
MAKLSPEIENRIRRFLEVDSKNKIRDTVRKRFSVEIDVSSNTLQATGWSSKQISKIHSNFNTLVGLKKVPNPRVDVRVDLVDIDSTRKTVTVISAANKNTTRWITASSFLEFLVQGVVTEEGVPIEVLRETRREAAGPELVVKGHKVGQESFREVVGEKLFKLIRAKTGFTGTSKVAVQNLNNEINNIIRQLGQRSVIAEVLEKGLRKVSRITIESARENEIKSSLEKKNKQELIDAFVEEFTVLLENSDTNASFINDFSNALLFARSSPSYLDKVEDKIVSKFLGKSEKRFQDVRQTSVVEFTPKQFIKTTIEGGTTFILSAPIDEGLDLQSQLEIINFNLHDYIRRNMGQGNAPKRLNYRTGRFARSAEILSLLPTRKGSIDATITYLRNPYDVFLPGGRLHNELRDPRKLIGKSVRQILTEKLNQRLRVTTTLA